MVRTQTRAQVRQGIAEIGRWVLGVRRVAEQDCTPRTEVAQRALDGNANASRDDDNGSSSMGLRGIKITCESAK